MVLRKQSEQQWCWTCGQVVDPVEAQWPQDESKEEGHNESGVEVSRYEE